MRIKLIPVIFFFVIICSSFSAGYSVEPVWDYPVYHKGDIAQFDVYGDKNQTNITAILRYYYQSNPNNRSAIKFFEIPKLNITGHRLFQFRLNESNGIREHGDGQQGLGFYNLTFTFGVDIINESGVQLYEAQRSHVLFEVEMSDADMLAGFDAFINRGDETLSGIKSENSANWGGMVWYAISSTLIILWLLFVVYWHSKYDIPIRIVLLKKLKALHQKLTAPTGDLYPMINADNMKELKTIGLGLLGDQEKNVKKRREFHKAKFEFFDGKLKRTQQDRGIIEDELLKKDPDDPHVWILKQHSDSTIELGEAEVQFVPGKIKKYRKAKKGVAKSDN